MNNKAKYLILIIILSIVIFLTMTRNPQDLSSNLYRIALESKYYAAVMHILLLALFAIGLIFRRTRKVMFVSIILILSGSALFMSFKSRLIPNIFVFGTIFILTIISTVKKEIDFSILDSGAGGKVIAFLSVITGLYYLHWVEYPVFYNALFYSPIGIINCPTLIMICGILIFIKRPGAEVLELFTGFATLYFGFFGIMRLGAYIDIILLVSSLYLLSRRISTIENDIFYKNSIVVKR